MELSLMVFPDTLVQGTMVSCAFYAAVLFGCFFFQKYVARKKNLTKKDESLLLILALWLLLVPSCLYGVIYILNVSLPLLSIYILIVLIMMVPLRLVGELIAKNMGIFLTGIYSGLLLLCTYVLMPECFYNILVFGNILPFSSSWLGIVSYGSPFLWIVLEFFGERGLKSIWRRLRQPKKQ